MKYFLSILPLLLGACTGTPKFEHRTPAGVARADDPAEARMLATMANFFAYDVCATLDVEVAPPFVIERVPDDLAGLDVKRDSSGRVLRRRIVIGDKPMRTQSRFTVAHELVHWYASDPWDRLPHAVEEGLADYIAVQLAPELRDPRVAELVARQSTMTPERRRRALDVTKRHWMKISQETRLDTYAVGYEIVERLGIDRLREMCVRARDLGLARVPLEWIE